MEYQEIKAVNFSTLKYMAVSPLAYRYALEHPPGDTPSMRLGRAVHCAVLEPRKFTIEYPVFKGARRAGKAWDEFEAEHAGATILKADEYEDCLKIHDAVWSRDEAARLLDHGEAEIALQWTDRGYPCKGRLDWISSDGFLLDLKTAKDPSPRGFGRAAATYLYHVQMAWYYNGAICNQKTINGVKIIAVQNVPPWDVVVYDLPKDVLAIGEGIYLKWLARLDECAKEGKYPGIAQGEVALELPAWARSDGAEDLTLQIGGEDYAL